VGFDNTTLYNAKTANGDIQVGQWYHIIGTREGSTLKLYVNGELNKTTNGIPTGPIDTDSGDLHIGSTAQPGAIFKGMIDDVRIYNRVLTAEQVKSLYDNGDLETIVSQETRGGDVWVANVTPHDVDEQGTMVASNSLTIAQSSPLVSNVILNSSSGTNLTSENLTVNYDLLGSADRAIINWHMNGTSIAGLNMPFEGLNDTDTDNARDYSGYSNSGVEQGNVLWNATGGYDSTGAYEFDGSGDFINITDSPSLSPRQEITLSAWFKRAETSSKKRTWPEWNQS